MHGSCIFSSDRSPHSVFHTSPRLSLTAYLPPHSVLSTPSLLWNFSASCLLLSIPSQHQGSIPSPSPLSSKLQGPFHEILVTPTAAMLGGLPHWIHLFHLKLFTLPPQDDFPSYKSTPTGLSSRKFQRTPRSTTLPRFQKNEASPQHPGSTPPD